MDIKNLYLIKGSFNYERVDYNFETLKLVRIKNIEKIIPYNLYHLSEFNISETYIYDENNNTMINRGEEILIRNNVQTHTYSIFTYNPLLLVGNSDNNAFTYIKVFSKSVFSIKSSALINPSITLGLYKKSVVVIKGSYTNTIPPIYSSFLFYFVTDTNSEIQNNNQIFDWDIIEL